MAYIYVITNNINGKQYVGKTRLSIQERFKEHIRESRKEKAANRPLYLAFKKYGIEHFDIQLLEECSLLDSSTREIYWIGKLDSYKSGYNATLGGDGTFLRDYKSIAEKYLELKSEQLVADFFHCDLKTVKLACKEYNIPIKQSSQIAKERLGKPVAMKNKANEIIRTFPDMADAGRYLIEQGIAKGKVKDASTAIGRVASGKRKSAYGFYWNFI